MRNRIVFLVSILAMLVVFTSTSANAGVVRQLTDSKAVSFDWPMPDGTGSEIFVVTSSDQFGGGNPRHVYQIVAFDPTTGTGAPITSFESSLSHIKHNVSVSDDGQKLAFVSDGDLVPGQNGNRSPEVFVVMRDGTGLQQLTDDSTPNAGSVVRVALAGSGNRVAFASSSDLTGSNPSRVQQIFVIEFDGTGLTQLTQATEGEIQHMWISDDGTRIAFAHNGDLTGGGNPEKNYEVFTIALGDTMPRQVTSSVTGDSRAANISGDGGTIVFHSTADLTGGNADGGNEIFAADWATATLSQVTDSVRLGQPRESRQGWPTNDGQQIFYSSNHQSAVTTKWDIYKINTDGTGRTRLTNFGFEFEAQHPVVSGDGSQFAMYSEEGLYTATSSGSNQLELIDRRAPFQGYTDLSADGQWVSFTSDADPFGTNADHNQEAFVQRTDGTGLTQLTSIGGLNYFGAGNASINGDGSRIYFESSADLTGQNPDQNSEIFGINTDGTGLLQYSVCAGGIAKYSVHAEVSDDGNTVAFVSLCDLTGGNADFTGEIHLIDPDGQNLRQITSGPSVAGLTTYVYWPRLDATATWVVFGGNNNLAGGNPTNNLQVWRMRTDGTNLEQLTNDPTYWSLFPDISGDGSRIVFTSEADVIGLNADHNREIFLYEPGAPTPMRQLTQTTEGRSNRVRLTRDGVYAYFFSTSHLLEDDPDTGRYYLYRYHIDTDTIERASGLIFENTEATYHPGVSTDGSVVAFAVFGDGTGDNPDAYWEIQVAKYDEPNPPVISPGPAPTTVSFEPEPGMIRYDIIRGDVAQLQDLGGGVIDLGSVLCVENDSPDPTTAGYVDPATPALGQAFFYLFRGSMGMNVGPGSYGTGSNGSERVAGVGGCDP